MYAADYDTLAAQTDALAAIVRQIATITPHEGEWERSYEVLQARPVPCWRRARATLRPRRDTQVVASAIWLI